MIQKSIYLLCLSAWLLATSAARANITIYAYQEGGDVIMEYSGSLDITGLTDVNDFATGFVSPMTSQIEFGDAAVNFVAASAIVGPANFGMGGESFAMSTSGSTFGFCVGCSNSLVLPDGYVSNTPISGRMVFTGQTLATLGINTAPGSYVWTVNNPAANQIILRFADPDAAQRLTLQKKLKALKKKLRIARQNGQVAKAKRLAKLIAKTRAQIASL